MKSLKYILGALVLIVAVGAGCSKTNIATDFNISSKNSKTEVNSAGYFDEVQTVGGDKTLVQPSDIIKDGQGKDWFPIIKDPKFVSVDEMTEKDILYSDLSGVSVKDGDTYKFYPHQILAWHPVVEDQVNGEDVMITYSQLTEVSEVYSSDVNGAESSFATSGLVWNNNMLLYDDLSNTLWSQILGVGVYGKNAGVKLDKIPFVVMTWEQWSTAHPDGLVLSDDTGYTREYALSPYGTYLTAKVILFPLTNQVVKALDPKSVVVGVETDGGSKAFQEGPLVQFSDSIKNDVVGDTNVVAWRKPDGGVFIHKSEDVTFESVTEQGLKDSDGNEWVLNDALNLVFEEQELDRADTIQTFWFTWSVLHPDSHVYGQVLGKGLVDGAIDLQPGEGVTATDENFHLKINNPNFGGAELKVE